jgi:nucleotide-binding universal stress UspA family protein
VRVGSPAGSIVREAESLGAALIVVGLRHHGFADRLLRDETSLHVARGARVPVLAVGAGLESLPHRVVVGVDFSRASVLAARAALSVMDERGSLLLAYVRPDAGDDDESCEGIGVIEREGVAAAFEHLRAELAAPPGVEVATAVVAGEPAAELRALAARRGADLIAIGSHRHEKVERWQLGSVTTDLIRDGGTSVLVVPPAPPTRSVRRYQ